MLLALLPALGRAEEESLENLEIAHSTAMAAAQAEADKRMFLLKVGYEGALQKLAAELAESGDLDGALAVRRERTSFGDTPLSMGEMKALTPKIAMLRKKYDGALIANAKVASQEREALLKKFADMLLSLQRALATAGNGEASAAAGNAHQEALKELRDVSTGIQLPGGYDLFYTFDVEVEVGEPQHDLSPSDTIGTSEKSGWVESGFRGGAYGIQGGEKRIVLDPKLPFSGDAMTISAWVKLDKYGFYSRFWSQFEFGAKRGFVCVFHKGRPFLEVLGQAGQEPAVPCPREQGTADRSVAPGNLHLRLVQVRHLCRW